MPLDVVLFVLGGAATMISSRALFNAWAERRNVRAIRRRRLALAAQGADPLALLDEEELGRLLVESRARHVRFSRLTGWRVEDPRAEGCTVPPHLFALYANRFREAADFAAVIADVVLLLAGAALGYIVADLVTVFASNDITQVISVYVAGGLVLIALVTGMFRLWIVREWNTVAARFHALALAGSDAPDIGLTVRQAVTETMLAVRRRRWLRR
jgi:hypothetical protein